MQRVFVFFLFIQLMNSCKQRFFRASAGSMENTIMAGQGIYVTPSGKFERNDIAVFDYYGNDYNSPADEPGKFTPHWEKRVFRVIACSGDVLEIKNGEIFIDNRRIQPPLSVLFTYEIKSRVVIEEFLDKDPGLFTMEKRGDTNIYTVSLSVKEAQEYARRKPAIHSVQKKSPGYFVDDTAFAKGSDTGSWLVDDYGPLTIPSPGETIQINAVNYRMYKNIPGVQQGNQVLQEKLYFLMGDNRYNAEDSRYIGLIPHSKMYGIVK